MDRVVSSSTSTVRALAHTHSRPAPASEPALIVTVPDAPGTNPLPGVYTEADALAALMPGALRLDHPEYASVLAALPDYQMESAFRR